MCISALIRIHTVLSLWTVLSPRCRRRLIVDTAPALPLSQVSIRYHDGSVYEGTYVADDEPRKKNHLGRRTTADGVVLEGPCVDNHLIPRQITGFARMVMPTGESYEGDWVNGKRHGCGVAVMPDGSRYQGEWKAGVCVFV